MPSATGDLFESTDISDLEIDSLLSWVGLPNFRTKLVLAILGSQFLGSQAAGLAPDVFLDDQLDSLCMIFRTAVLLSPRNTLSLCMIFRTY